MDPEAARRARQKKIKQDLLDAYTDEEACPPEWVELFAQTAEDIAQLEALVAHETQRFVSEPDIRLALARRERVVARVAGQVEKTNEKIRRLNLLAPLPRFQRTALDSVEILRPLHRTRRATASREALSP